MKTVRELMAEYFEVKTDLQKAEKRVVRSIKAVEQEKLFLEQAIKERDDILIEHNKLMNQILPCKPKSVQATRLGALACLDIFGATFPEHARCQSQYLQVVIKRRNYVI